MTSITKKFGFLTVRLEITRFKKLRSNTFNYTTILRMRGNPLLAAFLFPAGTG